MQRDGRTGPSSKGGRPSRGERASIMTRMPHALKERIVEEAAALGLTSSDFLQLLAARALAVPFVWPAAREDRASDPQIRDHAAQTGADRLDRHLDDGRDEVAALAEFESAAELATLSPRAFAASLEVSSTRLAAYRSGAAVMSAGDLLRAKRIGSALAQASERGWQAPPAAGLTVSHAVAFNDPVAAFRACLSARDGLREAFATRTAVDAWEAAPYSPMDPTWTTLLAALVDREHEVHDHRPPRWTMRPQLFLREPWAPPTGTSRPAHEVRRLTPGWLAARGVYVAAGDLDDGG